MTRKTKTISIKSLSGMVEKWPETTQLSIALPLKKRKALLALLRNRSIGWKYSFSKKRSVMNIANEVEKTEKPKNIFDEKEYAFQ